MGKKSGMKRKNEPISSKGPQNSKALSQPKKKAKVGERKHVPIPTLDNNKKDDDDDESIDEQDLEWFGDKESKDANFLANLDTNGISL